MSCQQASRFISTSAASVTPEDPYVFTETVPTTPPFLYNTQKSRSRYTTDIAQTTSATVSITASLGASTITVVAPKTTVTHQKLPLGQINDNIAKAPASLLSTPAAATAGDGGSAVVTNAATIAISKNVTKSQLKQNDYLQNSNNNNNNNSNSNNNNVNNKKIANLCILRTEQQNLQESSPLLQHTPSLWQTPLMLETAIPMVSPPTSPASLPSPTLAQPFTNPIADTTLISTVTAPIAATLPPSKFHHTTLAQHLQKVQSIKKPKQKGTVGEQTQLQQQQQQQQQQQHNNGNTKTVKSAAPLVQNTQHPVQPTQHSDLNDIPVNVIFRKPQNSNDVSTASPIAAESECSGKRTSPPSPLLVNISSTAAASPLADRKSRASAITTTVYTTSPALVSPDKYSTAAPTMAVAVQHSYAQSTPLDSKYLSQLPPLITTAPSPTQSETSSIATSNLLNNLPAIAAAKTSISIATPSTSASVSMNLSASITPKAENSLQTAPTYISTPKPDAALTYNKPAQNRKSTTSKSQVSGIQKKNRKTLVVASMTRSSSPDQIQDHYVPSMRTTSAVAVMRVAPIDFDEDTSMLAYRSVLPYGLQRHWLNVHDSCFKQKMSREERINLHRSSLHRQAMQYLSTHKLQHLPFQEARQRLICVAELLEKYQNSVEEDKKPADKCQYAMCSNKALVMASYCLQHITKSTEQQIFLPCAARLNDNSQCSMPVFDVLHEMPLCAQHANQRTVYSVKKPDTLQMQQTSTAPTLYYDSNVPNMQATKSPSQQKNQLQKYHQQQPQPHPLHQQNHMKIQQTFNNHPSISNNHNNNNNNNNNNNKKVYVQKTNQMRKRHNSQSATSSPLGRPQKRSRKTPTIAVTSTTPPPLTAVLKRKSSTTSLESIASNSHSSSSQPQYIPVSTALAPPALAPLSGGLGSLTTNSNNLFSFDTSGINSLPSSASIATADDLREHEINQIVAQFASVANSNFNICNGNNQNQQPITTNSSFNHNLNLNLNQTSDSHNTNLNFISANSDSNFTSTLGSSSSLPSTDELLTQDMLSICENSSAYASSEDTGLGGLSETELMAGAHDADDIPLGDTRLLEEQELANVLNALPVDAFNEIFNTVRQDEYDEVERALELADKHLKTLQQTIGTDSDFLGDLLDVNDDFITDTDMCNKMEIVSSVMHSPNSPSIDPSALFMDNGNVGGVGVGVGVGNASVATNSCPTAVADVRGLVQT